MRYKKKRTRKIAVVLFLVSLAAMVLGGCVVADHNIRRVAFGEDQPMVSLLTGDTQKGVCIRVLGQEFCVDISPCVRFAQGMAQWLRQAADLVQRVIDG